MHIVIIGAGAVGGYFGALLHETGTDVTFVARNESLQALKSRGLRIHTPEGLRDVPVQAVSSLSEVESADIVLLATKTLSAPELPEALPCGAVLVTTQNSVEMPQIAIDTFGAAAVVPGVVRSFLTRRGPAEVEFTGGVLSFTFGSVDPATQDTVNELQQVLAKAGIEPIVHPAVMEDIWAKAMFVTCFGALGALVEKPLGDIRTTYRADLKNLMREVEEAGRALGINLPADSVDATLAFADSQAAHATSSMQRDILDGLPSELDAQVGAVVRMAERGGREARMHRLILDVLLHR
ncbi:2-dehydropantoate 2-reductase [Corynebacterium ulcerans]|uniref:2-dehydropantoate 2-reductase n=1 Tax=Corynebacterium ulcerans TaxID=65058 RepID=UPI000DA41911|nr:2-dehydropantoate 2-reductase [Corynebacterium ulcerans]SQG58302.1 ketopantoate reductase [Corynebacterium ulcerans]